MTSIDQEYSRIMAARNQAAAAQAVEAERRSRALTRARGQVFRTTSYVVSQSSESGMLRVAYCDTCPCIVVRRRDNNRIATRIEISMKGEVPMMDLDGGAVDVETNAPALRSTVARRIALNLVDMPMGMGPIMKWALIALAAVASIPLVIGLVQAALAILLIVVVWVIFWGAFSRG